MLSADSPWLWAASSSVAVRSVGDGMSVEDRGDAEVVAAAVGGVGERLVHAQRRPRLVGAEDVVNLERVRERLDAGRVDAIELVEVIEDGGELAGHPVAVGRGQVQPGEVGDPGHLVGGQHHTFGIENGFRLTGFLISPLRMALTATRIVLTSPSTSTFTRCRFGKNRRLVVPVIFRPTPPRYLALPRYRFLLPPTGFLPVIAHCMPMTHLPRPDSIWKGLL